MTKQELKEVNNNKRIQREQLLNIAKERGYTSHMHSSDNQWYVLSHEYYPFVIELWPDTKEFLLRYNTSIFNFSSSKAGSFDNEAHFKRFERQMKTYVLHIKEAEDKIKERNSK